MKSAILLNKIAVIIIIMRLKIDTQIYTVLYKEIM